MHIRNLKTLFVAQQFMTHNACLVIPRAIANMESCYYDPDLKDAKTTAVQLALQADANSSLRKLSTIVLTDAGIEDWMAAESM